VVRFVETLIDFYDANQEQQILDSTPQTQSTGNLRIYEFPDDKEYWESVDAMANVGPGPARGKNNEGYKGKTVPDTSDTPVFGERSETDTDTFDKPVFEKRSETIEKDNNFQPSESFQDETVTGNNTCNGRSCIGSGCSNSDSELSTNWACSNLKQKVPVSDNSLSLVPAMNICVRESKRRNVAQKCLEPKGSPPKRGVHMICPHGRRKQFCKECGG
jgi:hypothetical protein